MVDPVGVIESAKNESCAFNNLNGFKTKKIEIQKFLQDEKIHVFGIAETFLKNNQKIVIDDYKWVGKNRIKKEKGGIGFLISDHVNVVDDNLFDSRNDDLERMWVKLKFANMNKHVFVAVTYFPNEGVDPILCDEMYNKLLSEVLKIESEEGDGKPHILITGDMNGRIGDKIPFGDPVRNSNGNRLLNFSDDADLTITNCTKMCFGKITWQRGAQKSTIDYLLGSQTLMSQVRKMTVDEEGNFHFGSDHNVLILNVKPDKLVQVPTLNSTNSKGIVWKIGRNQDWYCYQNELSNEFSEWNAESFHDANSLWTSWKSKLINAATNTIGVKKGNNNKKNFAYDEDVKLAINERKAANKNHRVWLKSKNRDKSEGDRLWEIYKDKKESAKKLVRQKAMQKRFNDSIEISKKGGPGCRDFWKNLRGNKNCKNDLNCLRIPNTNDITYDKKVMNQSIMHYFQTLGKMNLNLNGQLKDDRVYNMDETYCFKTKDELYNASYQNDNLDVQVNDFEFSLDEVKEAITQCKNNKSPGLAGSNS